MSRPKPQFSFVWPAAEHDLWSNEAAESLIGKICTFKGIETTIQGVVINAELLNEKALIVTLELPGEVEHVVKVV